MKKRKNMITSFSINRIMDVPDNNNSFISLRGVFELILLLVILGMTTLLLRFGYSKYMKAAYPLKYNETIKNYADQYGFEPSLVLALIRTESGFDKDAVSSAKAIGLMQITEDTFKWAQSRFPEQEELSVEKLYDPETNIRYGILVLSMLRDEFEDTSTMLAAYNAGIGNVKRWLKDPKLSDDGAALKAIPFEETRKYVTKIPDARAMYKKLYDIN